MWVRVHLGRFVERGPHWPGLTCPRIVSPYNNAGGPKERVAEAATSRPSSVSPSCTLALSVVRYRAAWRALGTRRLPRPPVSPDRDLGRRL